AERAPPSPMITESAGQVTPDRLSSHVQWTVTSPAYQPLAFGAVVALPLIVGAVVSMLMPETVVVALLSAASTAVPSTGWPAPSVPTVTGSVQVATPERPGWSSHVKVTVTSALFQPPALGDGASACVMDGAVLSTFTSMVW